MFDGDDTLWATQPHYDLAKQTFFDQMEQLGLSPSGAKHLLAEIDSAAAAVHGFTRGRFPNSLVLTYRRLAELAGLSPSRRIEARLREVGYAVTEQPPILCPNAEEVLTTLRPEFTLYLLTKGDPKVQWQKIHASGLEALFDAIFVVPTKEESTFRDLMKEANLEPACTWSVGNSLRSDVNPALRAGMNAVWLARATWEFEEESASTDHHFHTIHDLAELPSLLQEN